MFKPPSDSYFLLPEKSFTVFQNWPSYPIYFFCYLFFSSRTVLVLSWHILNLRRPQRRNPESFIWKIRCPFHHTFSLSHGVWTFVIPLQRNMVSADMSIICELLAFNIWKTLVMVSFHIRTLKTINRSLPCVPKILAKNKLILD